MQIAIIGKPLNLAEELELKRIALDLEHNVEKLSNDVLNYLQRGHVWDSAFGWDGEENRLRIHEDHMTTLCELLWWRNMIVRYRNGGGDIYCSLLQWQQWKAQDPILDDIRLYPEQPPDQSLEHRGNHKKQAHHNTD